MGVHEYMEISYIGLHKSANIRKENIHLKLSIALYREPNTR